MAQRAWGIDVSDWQLIFDMRPLANRGGMDFVIIKASQGGGKSRLTAGHVAAGRAAGVLVGLYHWADPTQNLTRQVGYFSEQINALKPDFIAVDCEQWWADWSAYSAYLNGRIPASSVPRLNSTAADSFYHTLMLTVESRHPKLLLLNYTANWYILGYCRGMSKWIDRFPTWQAQYISRYGRLYTWDQFHLILNSLQSPTRLAGSTTSWDFWQWRNGSLILPGMAKGVDLNVFNGSVDLLWAAVRGEGNPNPTYYTCVADALWIRTGPGIGYPKTGYWIRGDRVPVYAIKNGWGKVSAVAERWSSMAYLK